MMAYVLPVMMTVFFPNLASGLNLYYAVQNLTPSPAVAHRERTSEKQRYSSSGTCLGLRQNSWEAGARRAWR